MRFRVVAIVLLLALAIGVALHYRAGGSAGPGRRSGQSTPSANRPATAPTTTPASIGSIASTGSSASTASSSATSPDTEYPIAAPLNAPNSTISRDLDTLQQIFDAWRTNFPREGNPVGENAEITSSLTGNNRLGLALIPPRHAAINARGELCDRWGTPFRFHQISGEKMEIRSAGPDRKFATADDAVWTPQ